MLHKILTLASIWSVVSLVFTPSVFDVQAQDARNPSLPVFPTCTPTEMLAKYYDNLNYKNAPKVVRCEALSADPYLFKKDWNVEGVPGGINIRRFSVIYSTNVILLGGKYELSAQANDQLSLYLDADLLIETKRSDRLVTKNIEVDSQPASALLKFSNQGETANAQVYFTPR